LPNIMLMIDNSGSMDTSFNISGTLSPNDAPATNPFSCINTPYIAPATMAPAAPAVTNMIVSGSTVKFCTNIATNSTCTNTTTFGNDPNGSNSSSVKCFANTTNYNVKYYNGASLGTFTGKQLNWYFAMGGFSAGSLTAAPTMTRMKMAKDAARSLVIAQTPLSSAAKAKIRIGLTTFDGVHGGRLLIPMGDLLYNTGVAANPLSLSQQMLNAIGDSCLGCGGWDNSGNVVNTYTSTGSYIEPGSFTPLAETLADIGRYFCRTGKNQPATNTGTVNDTNTFLQLKTTDSLPPSTAISTIFNSGSVNGLAGITDNDTTGTPAPIQYYCQKSAVILVTDGLPNQDREISASLRNYTGDCGTDATTAATSPYKCDSTPTGDTSQDLPGGSALTGTSGTCTGGLYNIACKNGTKKGRVYEDYGSDYLDDVSNGLFTMDLRPTWSPAKPAGPDNKNNLKTYAIGIADPTIKTQTDSPAGTVLKDAADRAGGFFAYADNLVTLNKALADMVAAIVNSVGSFSAIAANSSSLGVGSALFQAKYDTADWTGDFLALPLSVNEDKNGNGVLDTGEDTGTGEAGTAGNGQLDRGGAVLSAVWNAGTKIPAWDLVTNTSPRNIYTYNSAATTKGISFKNQTATQICNSLNATQRTAMGITTACSSTTDTGVWRLDYLRGDIRHEVVNTLHQGTYPTDPRLTPAANNTPTNRIFRNRARYDKDGIIITPDPWLLGDIVNSDAVYVSNENYGYDKATGLLAAEKSTYKAFVGTAAKAAAGTTPATPATGNYLRRKMIYVGANDGFLHGFDACIPVTATCTAADGGKEILAYMPNAVFNGLQNLSSPSYSHQYFVDGSPRVSDVYFSSDSKWHTVLVETTGAGGKGVFALDITDSTNFATNPVLWEVSTTDSPAGSVLPAATDLKTDTTTLRGFENNLGYTLSQASIGRMHDGSWAAIIANGYGSTNHLAVLYIIDIRTGAIIRTIDTKTGSATADNGLSTPFAADVDSDGVIDAIYAGDLLGNMWKFDVSSSTPAQWQVAYGASGTPAPLFTACTNATSVATCDTTRQPITNKPQIGKVKSPQTSGTMVYFGTGKYFESTDNDTANTKTQSFYGIWDECPLPNPPVTTPPTASVTCSTVGKDKLVQQSIVVEKTFVSPAVAAVAATATTPAIPAVPESTFDVRATSNTAVDYTSTGNKKGWFMDFVSPNPDTTVPPNPNGNNKGERIVSASLLRGGRIIFATLIPLPLDDTQTVAQKCAPGSKSTSWLMELNAISGSRVSDPVLNITGNGAVDSADVFALTAGGATVPASGVKMTGGSTKTPTVMSNPGSDEIKFTGSSDALTPKGTIEKPPGTSDEGAGRISWQQIIKN
jgi:type IV pilus assembly protein PilY1